MGEPGIPELTTEQIETLSSTAETAARKHILSKVSAKSVDRLDVCVEADGTDPLKVTVEINLLLSPQTPKDIDADGLVKEAVAQGHRAVEDFLRKIQ